MLLIDCITRIVNERKQMRALSYEKTGTLKTPRKVAERAVFKDMTTWGIIYGGLSELYRRFDTELYAVASFTLLAYIVWQRLGQ